MLRCVLDGVYVISFTPKDSTIFHFMVSKIFITCVACGHIWIRGVSISIKLHGFVIRFYVFWIYNRKGSDHESVLAKHVNRIFSHMQDAAFYVCFCHKYNPMLGWSVQNIRSYPSLIEIDIYLLRLNFIIDSPMNSSLSLKHLLLHRHFLHSNS